MAAPTVTTPRFEHHHSGLGLGTARPRISWAFASPDAAVKGWVQTAYELELTPASSSSSAASSATSSSSSSPQTFRIASRQSVLVPWPSTPLASREAVQVRVRAWGTSETNPDQEASSAWSPAATVEAALLDPSDFTASFITPAQRIGAHGPLAPIRFRKPFVLPDSFAQRPLSARLYITALGVFRAWINGRLVSDERLAPGWTSYKHRLAYRTLDVSDLLVPGQPNVVCAEVAEGWYAGRLGFDGGERFRYGDELALFAQLEVRHRHGPETWSLTTDGSWSAAASAITGSEIYDGETYDLGKEIDGWNTAEVEWPAAVGCRELPRPSAALVSPDAPPVRVTQTLPCKAVFTSRSGKTILDFGQNLVGSICIPRLELQDGDVVTLRHAEVMEDGELGVRPLRVCKATDVIVGASGKVLTDWSAQYTFHGFRYAQVDGWPAAGPPLETLCAHVVHSDMPRRGFFACSNANVNRLHENVVWSTRGNFVSVPTDCPQRDERLGWTGDLAAFCPTASFLFDTLGLVGSWLEDLAAEQLRPGAGGVVPLTVPRALPAWWDAQNQAHAVWGDAAVLVPAALYRYSADSALLERQFGSMKAWLDRGIPRAPDRLWHPDNFQLADWLDPSAPPDRPAQAMTDSTLVANAFLVHVTATFADLCDAVDKPDLAAAYRRDAADLAHKFQRRYITPDGNIVSLTQTAVALAVQFGLYPDQPAVRARAAASLDRLVRTAQFRVSTGFAGTPLVTHALTAAGAPQLAYRMLLETRCPSWLYPVTAGATTTWERWDSLRPDGSVNPGEMTSFNHYALGAVADWLHATVGGLAPLDPGWSRVRVRPVPGGNITSATASFDGPFGKVACEWTLGGAAGDEFRMVLTVPPNSTAVVTMPDETRRGYTLDAEPSRTVGSGTHEFACMYSPGEWPPKPILGPMEPPSSDDTIG